MPLVCYNKPNRTHKRTFTARDVGRITAYARDTGADDVEILAQIAKAFGLKDITCLIYQVLDILNTGVFIGAIIGILKGVAYLVKGVKLLGVPARSLMTSALTLILPKPWIVGLGAFFLVIGAVDIMISIALIGLTSIANGASVYLIMKGICNTSTPDFNVSNRDIETGNLKKDLKNVIKSLKKLVKEVD